MTPPTSPETADIETIAGRLTEVHNRKMPADQYEAMLKICTPMIAAISEMDGPEIALAMKGFYAASESNCPWQAFALRWAMPPLLAMVGSDKPGYAEAFGMATDAAAHLRSGDPQ